MEFVRQPVVSRPHDLTPVELYILIESYQFLKSSAYFPDEPGDITELEIAFLRLAYEHHKDLIGSDVNNPAFEAGMKELNAMDKGGSMNV